MKTLISKIKKHFSPIKGVDYSELVKKWDLHDPQLTEEEYDKSEDFMRDNFKRMPQVAVWSDYNAYLLYKEISRLMCINTRLDWTTSKPSEDEIYDYNKKIEDIKDYLEALIDWNKENDFPKQYYIPIYKAILEIGDKPLLGDNASEYVMLQMFSCFLYHMWN